MPDRTPYPTEVSDAEWACVAPSPTPMTPDAPQRAHERRAVWGAPRRIVRPGAPWRWRSLPHESPPREAVSHQAQRRIAAGGCEAPVHDLRALLRPAAGRKAPPTAASFDRRPRQSTPERGGRAGHDGAKRRTGSTVQPAVEPLGHRLALHVTPANDRDRAQVERLAGAAPAATAEAPRIRLESDRFSPKAARRRLM